MPKRRDILRAGTVGAALAGLGLGASSAGRAAAADTSAAQPWLNRAFHMFTGPAGESVIRKIDVPAPQALEAQWLLRRPAERVTLGATAPGYLMDYHVASQPNILIPLFGTLVVKLKDGSEWAFRHGDILFAEDCTGGGHMSGAGPEGCFSVSVQLPKTSHCLDPKVVADDVFPGRGKSAF